MSVVWVLIIPASRPNYTSYKKFVFRDFAQNSWRFDMGMVILTSEVMEAVRDTTSDKKDTSQQPRLSPQSAREAPKKPAKRDS